MEAASPDGLRAADVFAAQLLPRPGSALRHRARIAGAFVAELLWGIVQGPSVHDVVVTRLDDGREVLRVPAGEPMVAGDMLRSVSSELERLGPEEFLAAWDVR